jgi:iron(III) transport system permease protein
MKTSRESKSLPPTKALFGWGNLIFLSVIISLIFAAIPIIYLLKRTFSGDTNLIVTILLRQKTLEILLTTIGLMISVAIISTVLGLGIAWVLQNLDLKYKSTFSALAILPIAIPSYIYTYTWMSIIPSLQGFFAALFILVLTTTPYITLASIAALRRTDWSQIEVAQTLGFNQIKIFRLVTWPQIRNTVSAGTLLVSLYVLSDFGAVALLGVDTFTRSIENLYRGAFDRSGATALALLLVSISALLISIEMRSKRQLKTVRTSNRLYRSTNIHISSGKKIFGYLLILSYLLLSAFIPMMQLLINFFGSFEFLNLSELLQASLFTISASLLGSLIALFLALPVGYLSAQGSRLGLFADKSLLVVHALPGIVMGLSLVAFGSQFPLIYQSVYLLAFAYALLFMAKAVGFVRSSFMRVPLNLMEISTTLQQTHFQSIRRVMIPLATPTLLTATFLVFLSIMKELPATLMLRPTGYDTLATQIWSHASILQFKQAAPYALLLVLIASLPAFLISRPDKNSDSESSFS